MPYQPWGNDSNKLLFRHRGESSESEAILLTQGLVARWVWVQDFGGAASSEAVSASGIKSKPLSDV